LSWWSDGFLGSGVLRFLNTYHVNNRSVSGVQLENVAFTEPMDVISTIICTDLYLIWKVVNKLLILSPEF
jgi:hypothetical protein